MDLTLNETPIRTAKNYAINNIKLENIEIPENIQEFKSLKILGDIKDYEILEMNKFTEFKYGNGEFLENQIKDKSNKTIAINVTNTNNKELQLAYEFSEDNKNLIENIEINLKENSNSTIVLDYKSTDNTDGYHNSKVKVIANKEANKELVQQITDSMITKIIEINADLPMEELQRVIGDKIAVIRNKKQASIEEIQGKLNSQIQSTLSKIVSFKFG